MKLREKFNAISCASCDIEFCDSKCLIFSESELSKIEEIAEEFAIGFALWKEAQVTQDDNGLYYGESRIAVSRKNPVDIYKLLEIYKKEKRL
jgi:hypothetical protein